MTDRQTCTPVEKSRKLSFKLTDDQRGPFPVTVESLWCDPEGIYYRVKNIPFFIDSLSFDDLIAVSKVDDHLYQIDSVVSPSKNSTIWVLGKNNEECDSLLASLRRIGCGIEGGVFPDYFAINVPSTTDLDSVLRILSDGERLGWVACDYPSVR